MEERLRALETLVHSQSIANARLEEQLKQVQSSLRDLTDELAPLRDAVLRGRGAIWIVILIASSAGGALIEGIRAFVGR